jgi:ribosome-associated heat shock protein Hsp15
MLYQETPESQQARALAAEHRRLAPEPAHSIDMGRQTKRDRRQIQQAWSSRWSASID